MSTTTTGGVEREFRFEQSHFEILRALARAEAGIELNDSKRELVYGRIARRLRQLGISGFDEYCQLVTPDGSPERVEFVNCITTNLTSFFREPHHFDFLRDEALPQLMQQKAGSRRLRIWSSACSTGQEPYSIAMTTMASLPAADGWDTKILATDIDSNVVARADSGIYRASEIGDLGGVEDRQRWFRPVSASSGTGGGTGSGGGDQSMQISANLRKMIYFRVLNLMDPWPMSGPLDIIFCRNVVIYFSKETQRRLFDRFAEILAPGGYLFIGHSESILHGADVFEPVGRTVYRRIGGAR